MPSSSSEGKLRVGRGDVLGLLTLLGTSVVIALPILRGGHVTYVDNPVHLAEIYDLARSNSHGWSEISFAGFPLGTLHSPLWYPLLAGLTRLGVALEPLYAALLVLSFAAPSLAFYVVARRRLEPVRAGALAYVLLVQPPMIWGIGSPLAGMWTHALAAAGLILLADLLARPQLTPAGHFGASLLLAFVIVTHSFAWPAVLVLIVVTSFLHSRAGLLTIRERQQRALAWLLAGLASAQYWLTFALVATPEKAPQQQLTALGILVRLLLPSDAMLLANDQVREAIRSELLFTDAVPMVALVLMGVAGFLLARDRQDTLGKTGLCLATVFLAAVLIHAFVPLPFLGPVAWRLLSWVQIGLALAAVALLEKLDRPARIAPPLAGTLAVCGCALGLWWGLPLRTDSPPAVQRELREIEKLWAWLSRHARPDWGRIYLQDTFGYGWHEGGLAHSHVLALTSKHVGRPQLGTYYGIVPYTMRWTLSEFDRIYSQRPPTAAALSEYMGKTNVAVLVASRDEVSTHIRSMNLFDELHHVARYTVFKWRDAQNEPILPLTPANRVEAAHFRTGQIRFRVTTTYPRTRVLAKTSFHPWWHVSGIPNAYLRESPEGFLVIDNIPKGTFQVELEYRPSAVPTVVSALGCAALAAWGMVLLAGALRRGRPQSAS